VRESWGYLTEYGPRRGTPPAGSDHKPIATLGPEHLAKAAAIMFETRRGLNSGQAVDWGAQGVTVMADGLRWHVPYGQIRSITPPTAAGTDLVKSANVTKKASTYVHPGDTVRLRSGLIALVQQVDDQVVHVTSEDGCYRRVPVNRIERVTKRASRSATTAPIATTETQPTSPRKVLVDGALPPVAFRVGDVVGFAAGDHGELHGAGLVTQLTDKALHVIVLPGGSLMAHQTIALRPDELAALPLELVRTLEPGDIIRAVVSDGLESGPVAAVAPDGIYIEGDAGLVFIPAAFVIALHRSGSPRRLDAVAGEGVA
jgi:hypothetical protein